MAGCINCPYLSLLYTCFAICSDVLSPNTYTFPVESTIDVIFPAAAIEIISFPTPFIVSGIVTVFVSPFPNCPELFSPHVYSFPWLSSAIT